MIDVTIHGNALQGEFISTLSFWDAMIWATVKEAGGKQLISEDFQNGIELEGVTFINPFELDDPVRTLFGNQRPPAEMVV